MPDDLERLRSFRADLRQLVALRTNDRPEAAGEIHRLQRELNEAYGELAPLINSNGNLTLTMPALGTLSHDAVFDAINNPGSVNYALLVRGALSHVDQAIGRHRRGSSDQGRKYRLTSPLYWIEVATRRAIGLGRVRWVRIAIVGLITVGLAFFTVFGADWGNVMRNVNDLLRIVGL